MLELDMPLPLGALCGAHPDAVASALSGAHWWHGSPAAMQVDPANGAVDLWRNHLGGPPAEPTEPNTGNGQLGEIGDLMGLQCKPGTHCGLVAEDVTQAAGTTTLAIRFYTPPGEDARTLLTLNALQTGNYLFLSETAGTLTIKDDSDLVETTLPCPPQDAPRLAIVSLSGDHLAATLGQARTDAQARAPVLNGPASLFIGCRNQRPRLLKTLGGALILDVWLFPGRALLHSDDAADRAALNALKRHHLWAEG
ncbi:hypothetical protein [Hasllibacter sp. MH4015]|uniref:hypothetical protein n=1 Tax=Hasllibacter sp. MH4015 TaxID=2854029 RepID=UPI001CD2D367|nr:hypothetical protein [Hasllibacter sp. MH4015]